VIEGLQEFHERGLIHRDVKSSNCFLENEGRVKIGDFGLSKSLDGGADLTRNGTFLGTPLYASPEQIKRDEVNERTDVYSVAATLYYLIAGHPQARPGRRVYLDIRANPGRNLEDMHKGLATLQRRPDALIVFSGHNEFLSRFETMRDAGYAEAPEGAFLHGLHRFSLRSPLCLWVYETVRKHRLGGPPPALNHHLSRTGNRRTEPAPMSGSWNRSMPLLIFTRFPSPSGDAR